MTRNKHGNCALCNRVTTLTFHHLIPRKLHRRRHFQRRYSKEQLNRGIDVCRKCHNGLHKLFDEGTLGRELNTLQKLLDNNAVIRHRQWVAKQR